MRDGRTADSGAHEQAYLSQVLHELNEEGNFRASVLVSVEGLPLSAASSPFDTEVLAAMVTLVRNTVEQARENIGLDDVDEVSVVQGNKMRLICRSFSVGEEDVTLAIIAPPYQTYRRLTNQAIRRIRLGWERRRTP